MLLTFEAKLNLARSFGGLACRLPILQRLAQKGEGAAMDVEAYSHIVLTVERAHRLFLDLVKVELEGSGVHDINNVQALMAYNIGDADMTVGELTLRGCHLGSNVSYNVKKMVENGYLATQRSTHDLRSIHVKLTDKGRMLRDLLSAIYQRHVRMIHQARIT